MIPRSGTGFARNIVSATQTICPSTLVGSIGGRSQADLGTNRLLTEVGRQVGDPDALVRPPGWR
jgi:hypothetical protein